MNSNNEIDLLAKEIVKGHPLIKCLNISIALDRLIDHREENIATLYKVASELDKHTRKSSIAKCVGSAAGTQGKIALGMGVAAVAGAPLTGFISAFAGGALLVGGGTVAALGSATSLGTYFVEYMLCKKQLDIANSFITADKKYVEQYQKDIESLTVFCSQYDNENTAQILLKFFSDFKDFVSGQAVDFKGIAEKMGMKEKEVFDLVKQYITGFNTKSTLWATSAVTFLSSNPAVFLAGGGASILFLDVFVLFKNSYNIATNEGHPTANELRNYAANLEKETEKLKAFSQFFKYQIHGRPEAKSSTNQKKYQDDIPVDIIIPYEDKDDASKSKFDEGYVFCDETDLVSECSSDEY